MSYAEYWFLAKIVLVSFLHQHFFSLRKIRENAWLFLSKSKLFLEM